MNLAEWISRWTCKLHCRRTGHTAVQAV